MKFCTDPKGFDKVLHFLAGALVMIIVGTLLAHISPHLPWLAATAALAVVVVVAAVKEVRDSRKSGNHFCVWDFLCTVAGGIAMSWLPWLAAYLLAVNG